MRGKQGDLVNARALTRIAPRPRPRARLKADHHRSLKYECTAAEMVFIIVSFSSFSLGEGNVTMYGKERGRERYAADAHAHSSIHGLLNE